MGHDLRYKWGGGGILIINNIIRNTERFYISQEWYSRVIGEVLLFKKKNEKVIVKHLNVNNH